MSIEDIKFRISSGATTSKQLILLSEVHYEIETLITASLDDDDAKYMIVLCFSKHASQSICFLTLI